ncbi:MAG TPA: TVP38/TMEM64 family protein, partial [Lachnospiraceae bacterium]|nr:TVP38/TMEM64 family protein [Lachnospiraceae bacterium]
YGITDISFWAYSIGTFIFMIPGTAMYTIGFAGLADSEHRLLYIGIAVLIAIIAFGTAALLRKKYITEEPSDTQSQEEEI